MSIAEERMSNAEEKMSIAENKDVQKAIEMALRETVSDFNTDPTLGLTVEQMCEKAGLTNADMPGILADCEQYHLAGINAAVSPAVNKNRKRQKGDAKTTEQRASLYARILSETVHD